MESESFYITTLYILNLVSAFSEIEPGLDLYDSDKHLFTQV